MTRQQIRPTRLRRHDMLMSRTSAHARAAATAVLLFLLFVAAALAASAVIWPASLERVGLDKWDALDKWVADLHEKGHDRFAPYAFGAAALLALLAIAYAVRRTRRWRLERMITRISRSMAVSDPTMVDPTTENRQIVAGIGPPTIQRIGARPGWFGLERQRPRPRKITSTTNVVGGPRLEIVYFRLFMNQLRHVSFMKGAWREFGAVSMLRSADSMTIPELRAAKRSGEVRPLFVTTQEQLEKRLAAPTKPASGVHRLDAGPRRVTVRDHYGAYPVRSILCADSAWRAAVNRLLDTADLVVIDLSGFRPDHEGTAYELQRVLDRVPVLRVVFLADPHSKMKLLNQAITDAWHTMLPSSPNCLRPEIPIWIAPVDRIVRRTNENNQTTSMELVTSRRETRRLMTMIQQVRLPHAPSISQLEHGRRGDSTVSAEVDPWVIYGAPVEGVGTETARPTDATRLTTPPDPAGRRLDGPRTVPATGRWLLRIVVIGAVVALLAAIGIALFPQTEDATDAGHEQPPGNVVEGFGELSGATDCASLYVVQVGAFTSEAAALRRLRDVEMVWSRGDVAPPGLGWLRGSHCGLWSDEPSSFLALAGPFANEEEAHQRCRSLRVMLAASSDEFPWAFDTGQLPGYRRLDTDFRQCN